MRLRLHSILLLSMLWATTTTLTSCDEDPIDIVTPGPSTPGEDPKDDPNDDPNNEKPEVKEGISYSPEAPDADQELKITFTAAASSPLHGYKGDVYAHIGIVDAGTWLYVIAEWNENTEKCKMTPESDNSWSLTLAPSIRDWFSSDETSISSIGLVIRSADGSLKGIASDFFIPVTDNTFEGFVPAPIVEKSLPAEAEYGINIVDDSTITFVVHDCDTKGKYHDYAHIVGDFNDWTLSNTEKSQMYRDNAAECWWITITGLNSSTEYAFQYYLGFKSGESVRLGDPYAHKILDPDNDKYIPASTYPAAEMTYPEGGRGVVSVVKIDNDNYAWQNNDFEIEDKDDLVIYELLLRDFSDTSDIDGAMEKLDYLEALGVNAIELMPVQEFDGNDSWGYNPAYFFAMDKAYGTDEDYKRFVDECHSRGIAVILDVVYNHATGNNPLAKLYWDSATNKTAANNPYFNVDAPHPYSVFHDFNHENKVVRSYVKRNLEYLLEEYRFDGFRFDLTKGFTQKSSTENSASQYDASRIAILKDYYSTISSASPSAIMICEHFCDTAEERELANAGLKVWRNANNAYCQSAMGWSSDSAFDYIYSDGSMPFGSYVGFMESHDEERTAYKAATYGNGVIKTDLAARMGNLEVNAAFSLLVPGPKMIWQFGEMGYDISIEQGGRTGRKPLHWEYLDIEERKDLHSTYSNLLALRQAVPTLFDEDATLEWRVSSNDWDNGRYMLLESKDGKKLVLAGNFTEKELTLSEAVPSGWDNYYEFMSSESRPDLGGSKIVVAPHSFKIYTNFNTTK